MSERAGRGYRRSDIEGSAAGGVALGGGQGSSDSGAYARAMEVYGDAGAGFVVSDSTGPQTSLSRARVRACVRVGGIDGQDYLDAVLKTAMKEERQVSARGSVAESSVRSHSKRARILASALVAKPT